MIIQPSEVMKPHIPTAPVIRVVTGENIHQRADRHLQDVARARGINLEATTVRPHANDTTTSMLKRSAIGARGLHESKVTASNVKPPIDPQTQPVRGMIRRAILVTKSDVLHEDVLLLRHTVMIGINKLTQVRRMHQVKPVVIPHQPARRIDLTKDLRFIRATIAIQITQPNHPPALRIAPQRSIAIR